MDTEPPVSGAEPDPIEASLERGFAALEVNDFARARDCAQEALAADPQAAGADILLALVALGGEDAEAALSHAKDALEKEPDFLFAHTVRGRALAALGRRTEAERAFLEVLQADADDLMALQGYAGLLVQAGHTKKARMVAERAVALDPEDPDGHALLAAVAASEQKGREAIASGRTGLGHAPEAAHLHYLRGLGHLHAGRPFRARRDFREAVRLEPDDTDYREAFLESDRDCRWIGLPYYYYGLVVSRLPGGPFVLWGVFVGLLLLMESLEVSPLVQVAIVVPYVLLCIYTWVAGPLVRGWTRLLPPRF